MTARIYRLLLWYVVCCLLVSCSCCCSPLFYRGVTNFELYCAEKEINIPFDTFSSLYEDPTQLDLIADPRVRSIARSMIEHMLDERYNAIYKECTEVAKELAHTGLKDLLPGDVTSVADAAGKVAKTVLPAMAPIPNFLKPGIGGGKK